MSVVKHHQSSALNTTMSKIPGKIKVQSPFGKIPHHPAPNRSTCSLLPNFVVIWVQKISDLTFFKFKPTELEMCYDI